MNLFELALYLLIYSLLGWGIGVACTAILNRQFANTGFLNLPVAISEGITAVILLLVLPTLDGNLLFQFIMTWVVVFIMDSLTAQFLRNMSRNGAMTGAKGQVSSVTLFLRTVEALFYLTMYLLVHPFVGTFVDWLPDLAVTMTAVVGLILVLLDFLAVCYAMRTGKPRARAAQRKARTQRMADSLSRRIWERLEKAYPGMERLEQENRNRYTFAKGLCFDKLVWVFLIASFLGALIEMVYCRMVGGTWMNRSSLLYGCFSVVWGFGAVILTVILQRYAAKPDRVIFLVGFVVGGAYEYLCSVFTEVFFGTVFWDYSYMPLNIGGRTNVLFCVFWGILAVVWIRMIYPPMDRGIEKLPPLIGKVLTWVVVFLMVCNCVLTAFAMERYTQRQIRPEPESFIEEFLDANYDDPWMEKRWPNMLVTE